MPDVTPLEIFRRKQIDATDRSSAQWSKVPAAHRTNALFSAHVEKAALLQRMQTLLDDYLAGARESVTLPDGTQTTVGKVQGKADFIKQMREFMINEGMDPDAKNNKITNIGSRSRLSLIFDTQVRAAYGQARWEQGMAPDMLKAYPAWRFVRNPGARVKRELHVRNEGQVRLKTDYQFWAQEMNAADIGGFTVPWPPFGFNSYMDLEAVSAAECERLGVGYPDEQEADASMFGATVEERAARTEASVKKIDDDLRKKLLDELKGRLGEGAIDKDGKMTIPKEKLSDIIKREREESRRKAAERNKDVGKNVSLIPDGERLNINYVQQNKHINDDMEDNVFPIRRTKPSKVGDKVKLVKENNKEMHEDVKASILDAINAIDMVHKDGPLPRVKISESAELSGGAVFDPWLKHPEITVSGYGNHIEFSTLHEGGHFIDLWGLGGGQCIIGEDVSFKAQEEEKRRKYGSERSSEMSELIDIILNSHTVKKLQQRGGPYDSYLLTRRELFARAYAQFIAVESGDKKLLRQLESIRMDKEHELEQWTDNEFKPIRNALRNLFVKVGWM